MVEVETILSNYFPNLELTENIYTIFILFIILIFIYKYLCYENI